MIKKLPRWVETGGFLLAFVAGSINAVGLLEFSHQAVSHLTGTTSLLGTTLAMLELEAFLHLSVVVFGFVAGATLSGVLLEHPALKLGRHYGTVLVIESVLIYLTMLTLEQKSDIGHYLASAACGLQNAMVTTYSGAVVRTTHMTGMFTDLGLMIGARIRGIPFDRRRALLYLHLIVGFIVGGAAGAWGFKAYGYGAFWIPSLLALLLAIGYWIYYHLTSSPP